MIRTAPQLELCGAVRLYKARGPGWRVADVHVRPGGHEELAHVRYYAKASQAVLAAIARAQALMEDGPHEVAHVAQDATTALVTAFTAGWLLPGRRVRRERKLLRLTQRQLAREAGVAQSTVSRVEAGGVCRVDTVARLAVALTNRGVRW